MPAVWARHEATWLSWPHNPDTWPGCLDAVEAPMLDVVAALAEVETVHINVLDAEHARYLEGRLASRVPRGSVELHEIPTNDAWCRDHGAIFVLARDNEDEPMLAHEFGYNAWGGKYPPYDLDQAVAGSMAEALDVPGKDRRAQRDDQIVPRERGDDRLACGGEEAGEQRMILGDGLARGEGRGPDGCPMCLGERCQGGARAGPADACACHDHRAPRARARGARIRRLGHITRAGRR